jgi:CheY-like chemotaxis protein
VVLAGSAEAGLEHLPYHGFDVAILDHRLPGMEGLVLAEYLHRNNPQMDVVLMTGDPDPRLHRVAEAAGLVLLKKPFDLEVLEEILARAVARDRARAEAQTPKVADPSAGGPIDLVPHFEALAQAFAAPSVPTRLGDLLHRRIREALEQIRFQDGFDERARSIAFAGIVAAEVLGVRLPKTRQGTTLADWYDALMLEAGRPRAFGDGEG